MMLRGVTVTDRQLADWLHLLDAPDTAVRRAVIDKHVRIPAGMHIGEDPEVDRRRFHVTPGGVTLVTMKPAPA